MANSWKPAILEDLIEVRHGFAFSGEYFTDEPRRDVLVTPGNFAVGGGFSSANQKYYDGPVPEEFVLSEGDLIVTMTDLSKTSDTLGLPAIIPAGGHSARYLHNQRIGKVQIKPRAPLDKGYLYYLMCDKDYRNEILASSTGTAVKHSSPTRIGKYRFYLPSLSEQRSSARILGSFDDKIQLNRRMNETLEAIGRALFKSWFVDFDPVRTKAEGRDTGLPTRLSDLFPADLVERANTLVPRGWDNVKITELADVVGGSTPSTRDPSFWNPAEHCWATPRDLSRLSFPVLLETERHISEAGLRQISSGLLPPGTVLLSSRAPIGYLAINAVPVAINQGFIAMKPRTSASATFLMLWAQSDMDKIISQANGSTFLEISKTHFRPIRLTVANAALMEAFEQIVQPLFDRMVENERESATLYRLRDIILPKLISGELRVNDAETFLEVTG